MSNSGQNRWIVLLNKNPKGPLTADEIRALMNQGILRANDVGYMVNEGDLKARSEWKLLWQFPEFNRRKTTPEPVPDTSTPKERRNQKAPEEIKKQALEDLPAELIHISPEDLLPKSTSIQFNSEPTKMSYSVEDLDLNSERSDGKGFSARNLYIGGALVLALAVASSLFFKKTTLAPVLSKTPVPNREVAAEANYGRPLPPVRSREYVPPTASVPRAPQPPPMDPGPAPVRELGIQKNPDEVEATEEARDDEEPAPKKPKIVKSPAKRKVTSEEEEDEEEVAKNDEDEAEE